MLQCVLATPLCERFIAPSFAHTPLETLVHVRAGQEQVPIIIQTANSDFFFLLYFETAQILPNIYNESAMQH